MIAGGYVAMGLFRNFASSKQNKKMARKIILILSALLLTLSLSAQQPQKRIKVACVGNSITEGVGSGDYEQNSYPAQLQQLLGKEQYRVRNFGKSGHTLMSSGDRPWIKSDRWQDARKWKPVIVIIKLGTNDSKPINASHIESDFRNDLIALVDSFQALPTVKQIYLCTPIPCVEENRYNIDGQVISQQIVPIIKDVARERYLTLIDLHAAMTGHADLFPDHVHPNKDGASIIARTVYEAIMNKK